MEKARDNFSESSIIDGAGILTPVEYDIVGNKLRAYYDANRKLVFVIDMTINDTKPNVLLIINSIENRKWDDILVNDYNVDLETVRPKKDNKYQKLDIEYSGLNEYSALINHFESGADLSGALAELARFRDSSIRNAAAKRLIAAEDIASKSRDTIVKTNETIAELQARIKQLRSKLNQDKKKIGKEPTKQSAAKILRSESQIDATNEKLQRAKKRLQNAQRRMINAEEDANAAREILARPIVNVVADNNTNNTVAGNIVPTPIGDLTVVSDAPVPAPVNTHTEIIETKAQNMADDEVKPLFDKDPEEILDEEIAFKPIDFDVPSTPMATQQTPVINQSVAAEQNSFSENIAPAPLSFVPPVSNNAATDDEPVTDIISQPVLDTLTAVDTGLQQQPEPVLPSQEPIAPMPVSPTSQNTAQSNPMPEIAPAPVSSDFRPVSPITGTAQTATPVQRKPTLLYYIMLIALIALSIFTLWIYQRSTSDNVPDLTAPAQPETAVAEPEPTPVAAVPENKEDSPFIPTLVEPKETVESVSVDVQPEPVPVVEPEPVPVIEPEPVPVVVEPEPVPVVVEPEPVPVIAEPEIVPEPTIVETPIENVAPAVVAQPEPVVNKPAYNVSQNENMFVASPDYDTETIYSQEPEYVDEEPVCADGSAPDMNGCCGGEDFTDMGDGTFACCQQNGDECYPPLF